MWFRNFCTVLVAEKKVQKLSWTQPLIFLEKKYKST